MLQEYDQLYTPYAGAYNPSSVGVLDAPRETLPEQNSGQPPSYPPLPPEQPREPNKGPRRFGAMTLLTIVLLLIFGTGMFSGWVFATSTSTTTTAASTTTTTSTVSSATEAQRIAAIAKVEPAVVEIEATSGQGEAIGSGVIIDKNGYIITNNHVVSGAHTITVQLSNGKTEEARLVGTSSKNDLAVLQIQPFSGMTVAEIGDSSALQVGQEVVAIGNPLGITETATEGIISALNRDISESRSVTISDAIQTSAAINPGNSGGALINLQGQLIGIPTLTAVDSESNTAANGVSFAIPSNLVKTVANQIINGQLN